MEQGLKHPPLGLMRVKSPRSPLTQGGPWKLKRTCRFRHTIINWGFYADQYANRRRCFSVYTCPMSTRLRPCASRVFTILDVLSSLCDHITLLEAVCQIPINESGKVELPRLCVGRSTMARCSTRLANSTSLAVLARCPAFQAYLHEGKLSIDTRPDAALRRAVAANI
jgi:hypothetical protein